MSTQVKTGRWHFWIDRGGTFTDIVACRPDGTLHGGYSYIKDFSAERLMRDAKITQIWGGTNQIHRQLFGRSFLKR